MGKPAGRHSGRGASRSKAGKGQPITRHPLFPIMLALWFGALFGLGSLAVHIGLIEALVLKLRLDMVLPPAAPPLGIKARALIALAMAITGGLVGLWLGRRLREGGRPKPQAAGRQGLAASLRRMAGREDAASTPHRQALAEDDARGEGWAGDTAPLSGDRPKVLSASDYAFIAPLPEGGPAAGRAEAPDAPPQPVEAAPLDLDAFLSEARATPSVRPFDAPAALEPEPGSEVGTAKAAPAPAGGPSAARPPGDRMSHLDLVNRLAMAMQARRERMAAARAAGADAEPAVIFPGHNPRPFDAPQAPTEAVPEAAGAMPGAQAPTGRPCAPSPAARVDREETERALRTALAKLQSMSGAA